MKTILLIDDNIDTLITLGDLLNRSGYRVIPKTNGESALSTIKEGARIDLVLLDHKVTVDDGYVLTALRHLIPSVPFIVLTNDTAADALLN